MNGHGFPRSPATAYSGKRLLDTVSAVAGILVLGPIMGVVALAIRVCDGSPVLYRQERVGQGGRPFLILKFRTMVASAERLGGRLTVGADTRITSLGRWLRGLKLDEMPQLLNVLAGDMSLVGPRPEVPEFVATYTDVQRRVLDLRPGLTDPASLVYWNESDILATALDPIRYYLEQLMPRKIALSLAYAREASLWRDILVLVATIFKSPRLLRRCGLDETLLALVPPGDQVHGR
jgi:lipopolysaccharide/colanic/teichoic acid biosynthesis glycosyltransferase